MHVVVRVWQSEDNLLSLRVTLRESTHIVMFGSQCLSPMSLLTSAVVVNFDVNIFGLGAA